MAPEIEGADIAGRPMKLSSLRGNVVVLTFWGDWCAPCRALYLHERKLVGKYADRAFAFMGVNTDPRDEAASVMARRDLPWRAWPDGAPDGPTCKAWGISDFPSSFLLDHTGRIRHRDLQYASLEKAIEALLAEIP
jgi:peroxiredoxin